MVGHLACMHRWHHSSSLLEAISDSSQYTAVFAFWFHCSLQYNVVLALEQTILSSSSSSSTSSKVSRAAWKFSLAKCAKPGCKNDANPNPASRSSDSPRLKWFLMTCFKSQRLLTFTIIHQKKNQIHHSPSFTIIIHHSSNNIQHMRLDFWSPVSAFCQAPKLAMEATSGGRAWSSKSASWCRPDLKMIHRMDPQEDRMSQDNSMCINIIII